MNVSRVLERESCLIGDTGFVGSTLARQAYFTAGFNSKTIKAIEGRRFGTIVCAAAPGSMFEANRFPDCDAQKVNALIDQLSRVSAERFVLISSIAVLADFAAGDDEGTQSFQSELAYGRHRRALEAFVEENFASSLIVRLPALFGHGLRKNFLFDLLNPMPSMLTVERFEELIGAGAEDAGQALLALYTLDSTIGMMKLDRAGFNACPVRSQLEELVLQEGFSALQFHNPLTTYQFYNMDRLWNDIEVATAVGLSHVHLVSEPLAAAAIHEHLIGHAMPDTNARLHHEDMRTRHASLWGRSGPYLADAPTILEQLAGFFSRERTAA